MLKIHWLRKRKSFIFVFPSALSLLAKWLQCFLKSVIDLQNQCICPKADSDVYCKSASSLFVSPLYIFQMNLHDISTVTSSVNCCCITHGCTHPNISITSAWRNLSVQWRFIQQNFLFLHHLSYLKICIHWIKDIEEIDVI